MISEMESIRQERDVLHDELRSSQHTLENLRAELAVRNSINQDSIQHSVLQKFLYFKLNFQV